MDIFGTDPDTVRTAVSAQLLFGALFFYLSMKMLPGYRMLPLWATANLFTFGALVLEAVGTGPVNSAAKLTGGVMMVSGAAMLWSAIRHHYNLPVNWRAGIAAWLAVVAGIGLPLWWFTSDRLVYTVFYHLLCGLVLLAALRDYARCQQGTWTVQTGLLMTLMTTWGLFSVGIGLCRIVHLTIWPITSMIETTSIPLAAGTTLIIIALNFFGFLLISQKLSQELNQLASTDSLTGAMNRRAFHRRAATLIGSSAPTAYLLMLDLDHFKQINDRHGHAAGDQVLIDFSETVRGMLRASDLLGRTGGEEFCVLLGDANEQDAINIAERIRSGVEAMRVDPKNGQSPLRVTVSIGIAALTPGATFDQVAAEADKALYSAKNGGRNRIAWAMPGAAAQRGTATAALAHAGTAAQPLPEYAPARTGTNAY